MKGYRIDGTVAELVLEHVHPSQWRTCPPSPEDIAYKAQQIGLVARADEALFIWEARAGYYPTTRGMEYQIRYGWQHA